MPAIYCCPPYTCAYGREDAYGDAVLAAFIAYIVVINIYAACNDGTAANTLAFFPYNAWNTDSPVS